MSLEQRLAILRILNHSQVLLDLDISIQSSELEYIFSNHQKIQVITSYHNYEKTPTLARLKRVIDTMSKYNPYMYKLATYCKDEHDALRLLQLLLDIKSTGTRVTVVGMGHHGQITRLFGTIWGNQITFAPRTQEEASAPGQLTRLQYEIMLKELGKHYGR